MKLQVLNCDPFKVSHVCICVFIILDVRNSLQYRALKKYCLVNECAHEGLPFPLVAAPALKRIFKRNFFFFPCTDRKPLAFSLCVLYGFCTSSSSALHAEEGDNLAVSK